MSRQHDYGEPAVNRPAPAHPGRMIRFWMGLCEEKGQALVEFALLVPVMLLMISGILDFGRMLYTYMNLNFVSEEAVRLGGLGNDDAAIKQFVDQHLNISDPAKLVIDITPADTVRKSGDYVTVTLKEPFTYITPLLSSVLPNPYTITTSATIREE